MNAVEYVCVRRVTPLQPQTTPSSSTTYTQNYSIILTDSHTITSSESNRKPFYCGSSNTIKSTQEHLAGH